MTASDFVTMKPCPFCEGPPCVTAHNRDRSIFRPPTNYPDDGIDVYARVWCHECGADGPKADDFVTCEADLHQLKRAAIGEWNRRDARHRGMFDHAEREELNRYPRKPQEG